MSPRHNMAFAAPARTEVQMIRDCLFSIEGVQRVFVDGDNGAYSVLVVVPDKNPEIQNGLFEKEVEIVNAFPVADFDFDVIFLCGRQLKDVVSPSGTELFAG
jgi:hypothetical protein